MFYSLLRYLSHPSLLSQFNSIQGALLAWETYVYIAKASGEDNIQKLNKQ
jgi:hypothetical protein